MLEGRWCASNRVIIATSSRRDHHGGLKKLLGSSGSSSSQCGRPANRAFLDKLSQFFSTSAEVVVNLDEFLNLSLSERSGFNSEGVCFMMREGHRDSRDEVSTGSSW